MSSWSESVADAVARLSCRDAALELISLNRKYCDAELAELVDCLLAHPDVVVHLAMIKNQLTDETGVKLARYLAASSTVQLLELAGNQFGSATYLALAAALRINSSLRVLYLQGNQAVDQPCIEAAFIEALRLNPDRPAPSFWQLFSHNYFNNDFERLKNAAEQLGHPSLLALLAAEVKE